MDLTIKASIPQLIAARDKALADLTSAIEDIRAALKLSDEACVGDGRASYDLAQVIKEHVQYGERNTATEKLRIALDRAMWRSFVVNTPLWSLMDTKARKQFDKDMAGIPPEATLENLHATMAQYFGDADKIFQRSLIETFRSLPNDYKSNDPFKLDKKIILGLIQDQTGYLSHYATDRLRDLDRVFWVLDGKEYNESYDGGLSGALRVSLNATRPSGWGASSGTCETEYFTVKYFKKGTAHATFKRPDLVAKANRMIAEYYGEVLPGDKKPQPKQYSHDMDMNYFPTPQEVARRMVEYAGIEDGMIVCEPSAGDGAIVREIKAQHQDVDITAYELDHARAEQSGARCFDWLLVDAPNEFDRIIMNPPFSQGRWKAHVEHAMYNLKPGGVIVAIIPNNRLSEEIEACVEYEQKLEAGTFRESGTMVATRLLVIRKEG